MLARAWFSLMLAVPLSANESSLRVPQGVDPALIAPLAAAPLAGIVGLQANASLVSRWDAPSWAAAAQPPLPERALLDSLSQRSAEIAGAGACDRAGPATQQSLDGLFLGRQRAAPTVSGLVRNDEGVWIMGRAAAYYKEIRRLAAELSPHVRLDESLDVIDGTIADVRAKLLALEALARQRQISEANTHLEQTLTWVDGVLRNGKRRIAVHTHQVYFHPAPDGPHKAESEVSEGIRRVDAYLAKALAQFAPRGQAEQALGALDEIILAFDTRGYQEIKEHLRQKEAGLPRTLRGRVRFAYLDELAPSAKDTLEIRDDYNRLAAKYQRHQHGLIKIIEGVMYSRYVGVLLELKTLEYYVQRGYTVLQSGRDMFGSDGLYITELDGVVKSPQGQVLLVEAKSARVGLPHKEALRDKVLYKLDIYQKHRAEIERAIGGPLNVVFSFDVGGQDEAAAARGELVWRDPHQQQLKKYLERQAPRLGARYGFPVSFLFLNSRPGADPLLFYQKANRR